MFIKKLTMYLGIHRVHYLDTKAIKQIRLSLIRLFSSNEMGNSNFPSTSYILNEQNRKACIERLKSVKFSVREPTRDNKKRAAVLIPLCLVKDEIALLYTLRRADLKRHKGQVSFPGGIEDSQDKSLEETALRETEEEIGIDRKSITLWGSGSFVVGHEFSVLPVVGYLGEINLSDLKPNPNEVEIAFTIPVNHLCKKENFRYTQFRITQDKGYILPVYINGQFRVWGITALITHAFLNSLLPQHYTSKVEYIKPLTFSQAVL